MGFDIVDCEKVAGYAIPISTNLYLFGPFGLPSDGAAIQFNVRTPSIRFRVLDYVELRIECKEGKQETKLVRTKKFWCVVVVVKRGVVASTMVVSTSPVNFGC